MPHTASLAETMMQQPLWLQAWIGLLMAVNLAAAAFLVRRDVGGKWRICWAALAILGAFIGAAMLMNYLYGQYGYVRLLGLAHLVFWTPVYGWILMKRQAIAPPSTALGKYLIAYLVVDGISLAIDAADVARYFAGTA